MLNEPINIGENKKKLRLYFKMLNSKLQPKVSRRNFFHGSASLLVTASLANAGVYIIGSAFKSLDGSLVAGAKSWIFNGNVMDSQGCTDLASAPPCNSLGATIWIQVQPTQCLQAVCQ